MSWTNPFAERRSPLGFPSSRQYRAPPHAQGAELPRKADQPLPRTQPKPQVQPLSTGDAQIIDRMRREGRLRIRYASDSGPYMREHDDPANWFLSPGPGPDGRLILSFDPAYRHGKRRPPPGELAKDPYLVGDVPGYPEHRAPWRRDLDQLFIREALLFNERNRLRPGDQRYLSPDYLKAKAMRETGGEGDEAAFMSDPLQIYVYGDWQKDKETRQRVTGLLPPPNPNTKPKAPPASYTLPGALRWLDHRRHYRATIKDPTVVLDDWGAAWRYNARRKRLPNGRTFGEDYADEVMRNLSGMRKSPPRYKPR